jgi:hypothetical protein
MERIGRTGIWTGHLLSGALLVGLTLPGCSSDKSADGGGGRGDGKDAPRPVATDSGGGGAVQPCQLLGAEQVATVLPGHDEGFVAKEGGSLIDGVDAYQCSYSNPDGDLLTVILNVAVDGERFEKIKPSGFAMGSGARKLDVADGGWLRGEEDDMKATVLKGHTVIDLELLASDAGQRKDALVDLARAVAAKAP